MKTSDLSNSKFLKQNDITEPMLVTITEIAKKNVAMDNKPPEYRGVMTFSELPKPLILNQTNIKRCEKAFNSDDMDDWLGKKIVIYVDEEVEFGGEIVGGLRLRGQKKKVEEPPRKQAASLEEMEDDIPFSRAEQDRVNNLFDATDLGIADRPF